VFLFGHVCVLFLGHGVGGLVGEGGREGGRVRVGVEL
jgi:hypothetical protein